MSNIKNNPYAGHDVEQEKHQEKFIRLLKDT